MLKLSPILLLGLVVLGCLGVGYINFLRFHGHEFYPMVVDNRYSFDVRLSWQGEEYRFAPRKKVTETERKFDRKYDDQVGIFTREGVLVESVQPRFENGKCLVICGPTPNGRAE